MSIVENDKVFVAKHHRRHLRHLDDFGVLWDKSRYVKPYRAQTNACKICYLTNTFKGTEKYSPYYYIKLFKNFNLISSLTCPLP